MGVRDTKDLMKFLKPFPDDVRKRALGLRKFIWTLYPDANELIYDNYNAVAVGWSPTDRVSDTFCSIAVGRTSYNLHLGFYWGSKIDDPKGILLGEGNQYRYLLIHTTSDLPVRYATQLIRNAYSYSLSKMKNRGPVPQGATITKSISPSKRPPAKGKRKK
jgi:hypothetical protein